MNILKKIISIFLIIVLLGTNITLANSNIGVLYKDLILTRNELKETKNGLKYINQIEDLIENNKYNEKILNKLEYKTNLLILKLENNNSSEYKQIKIIIKLLNLKTKIALQNLENQNIVEDNEELEEQIEEIKNEMFNSTLPGSEIEKVNEKLVEIQLNLLNNGVKNLKVLTDEFEKLTNYEEKGNFEMSLDFDNDEIGTLNAELNFINYIAKTQNFNSQLTGQVEGIFNLEETSGEITSLELSSLMDFISKDGNMYLLLENLNIKHENILYAEEWIKKIEEIAKENKYIKYDDKNSREALNILKALTPNKILSNGKEILNKPMFKPYKKTGNKYYLVPTKYACDKTKELLNKFDPFHPNSCSQGQYEDMIEELAEVGNIYITLGKNTTLGFEGISNRDIELLDGYITFSDTNIEELRFEIKPNQDYNPNEFFSIEFINNNKLNFNLFADSGDIDYVFTSKLDNNNNFTFIDYSGKSVSTYNEFYSNFKLENQRIEGGFSIYPGTYDWETGKYIRDNNIVGNIEGNTSTKNKLEYLTVDYVGTDRENVVFLDGKLTLKNDDFSLTNKYTEEGFKSNLDFSFTRNSNDKVVTALNFDLNMSEKQMGWDDINSKYSYSGDFEEIFSSNIKLDNKIISGQTIINEGGNEIINITHTGKYENKYFELNNYFKIDPEITSMMYQASEDEYENISGNFNIIIDQNDNNNNANIYFDVDFDEKKIIKFEMDNVSEIEYKDVEINVPSEEDTIDTSEMFNNGGYNYYY